MPKFTTKRDGSKVHFDEKKISLAIWKAVQSVGGSDRARSDKITSNVVKIISDKTKCTIENKPPIVMINGPYQTKEGTPITFESTVLSIAYSSISAKYSAVSIMA